MKKQKEFILPKNGLKPLIEYLVKKIKSGRRVILLEGELGAGKTMLSGLLVNQYLPDVTVQSPTFVIEKVYDITDKNLTFSYIHHLDLYRLKYYSEFIDLGLPELLNKKEHLFIFEWPEIIEERLDLWIKVKISSLDNGKKRKYEIYEKKLDN